MEIPQEDIDNDLPIRWVFHLFKATGNPWEFHRWRDYLLTFKQSGYESLLEGIREDKRFINSIDAMLKVHGARTPDGFMKFYQRCLVEYEKKLDSPKETEND